MLAAGKWLGKGVSNMDSNAGFEGVELIVGECQEKGFEENDGFPQAGVQIKVIGIDTLPQCRCGQRHPVAELFNGVPGLLRQILDHFLEGADLGQELGTMRKDEETEQSVVPRGALGFDALEILRVERRGVGNSAVVLGVIRQRPQQMREGPGEPGAEIRHDANDLIGHGEPAGTSELHCFIQGNAEYGVAGLEKLDVRIENAGLFNGQPGTPIIFD